MTFGMRSVIALLALIASALGATAAFGAGDDYPFHAETGPLTVHWSLANSGDRVQASGVIETTGTPMQQVVLDFIALDAAGKVIQRNREIVSWGFDPRAPRSFSASLPQDGRARDYAVWITGYVPLGDTSQGR